MNPPDRQSLPPAPSGWIAKIEAYALDSGAFVSGEEPPCPV